jgi:CheY-like chemotaxis protein
MGLLAETDRRKDEFLAILGHELRNPLAPMASSLELLCLKGDDAATRNRACGVLRRQLGMSKRLVDDLLDVSRITTQKLAVRREPVSLQHILAQALETTGPIAAEKAIELLSELTQEPIVVTGDVARLVQAISNLLNNAIKFSERNSTVEIKLTANTTTAEISIRDYGIGMSNELQTRAFELFAQGPGPNQGVREGLGVGLGIVKHIIDLHQGQIVVNSKGAGTGCEFLLSLPRSEQTAIAPARSTNSVHSNEQTCSILIADDNIDAANSLGQIFKALNYEVCVFHRSDEALAEALRVSPEVLILDVGMPGLSGYDLARHIRRKLGDDPLLIAATGYGQAGDVQDALEAGFDYHLTKPVDLNEILQLLRARSHRRAT